MKVKNINVFDDKDYTGSVEPIKNDINGNRRYVVIMIPKTIQTGYKFTVKAYGTMEAFEKASRMLNGYLRMINTELEDN